MVQVTTVTCKSHSGATALPTGTDASSADLPDATTEKPASLVEVEVALTTTCKILSATPDGTYTADCANGCKFQRSAQLSAKPTEVICAAEAGKKWSAPCLYSHHYGDGDPAGSSGGVECWQPPKFWCPGLHNELEAVGCNAAKECCNFPNSCIPCGWTGYLAGSEAEKVVGKLPCPDAHFAEKIHKCAICGDIVVCPQIPN